MQTLEQHLLSRAKWLAEGHVADEEDITMLIRNDLSTKGLNFGAANVSWLETEAIIENAIQPLRKEIVRLRELLRAALEGKP